MSEILVVLCILIFVLEGSTLVTWKTSNDELPYKAECIIAGYNASTGNGILFGGNPHQNGDIYNFTVNTKDPKNISINFKATNTKSAANVDACNGPLSTTLNNTVYYINNDTTNGRLTSVSMDPPYNSSTLIKKPDDDCWSNPKTLCLTSDNENTLYLMCDTVLFYYNTLSSSNYWTPISSSSKYNHNQGTCAYANNRVYAISGSNDCHIEYYDINSKNWTDIGCLVNDNGKNTNLSNTLSVYNGNKDIYILGGNETGNNVNTVFDIIINSNNIDTTTVNPLPSNITNMFGMYLDGHIFLFGGSYQNKSGTQYSNQIFYSETVNTSSPTISPTLSTLPPTNSPTVSTLPPTNSPTVSTLPPTNSPTKSPTVSTLPPTNSPTVSTLPPTNSPTVSTLPPTNSPTKSPTVSTLPPTNSPTVSPTNSPTVSTLPPTQSPTQSPTKSPITPTKSPTMSTQPPTISPTTKTSSPTHSPTKSPVPTTSPTTEPTSSPTAKTSSPTHSPTISPVPTTSPTIEPTTSPTTNTSSPTIAPTLSTRLPSNQPTMEPTLSTPSPTDGSSKKKKLTGGDWTIISISIVVVIVAIAVFVYCKKNGRRRIGSDDIDAPIINQ